MSFVGSPGLLAEGFKNNNPQGAVASAFPAPFAGSISSNPNKTVTTPKAAQAPVGALPPEAPKVPEMPTLGIKKETLGT